MAVQVLLLAGRRRPLVEPLALPERLFEEIAAEVTSWAPLETGVLAAGRGQTVELLVPAGPGAQRAPASFLPDVDFQAFALRRLRRADRGLRPLVFVHSHPFGPPRPSGQDRATCAEACAASGSEWIDIGIASICRDGEVELRLWRYLSAAGRFAARELRLTPSLPPEAAPGPFERAFAWEETPLGAARLVEELYTLERDGWHSRELPRRAAADHVALVVERGNSRRLVVFPAFFPYEPPTVLDADGSELATTFFRWSSAKTVAALLETTQPDREDARDG